jgi:hypothetical protein
MGGVAVNIMDMIKNGELEPENPVLKKIFKFHSMPEPKSAKWGKMMGRAGSEWGLIGLAIGVPHLFIDDYIDSQKGDRMARKLSSLLRKPIELRDIKDPRKLRGASNIRAEGGSLKSNPILYLANQPNTNVAAELFKDDVIGSTVYKAIIELFRDRNKIAGYLDQLKAAS